MTKSRSLSSLAFFVHQGILLVHISCNCFAFICDADLHTALERFAIPKKEQFQQVQFHMHVVGMYMHRLAQV